MDWEHYKILNASCLLACIGFLGDMIDGPNHSVQLDRIYTIISTFVGVEALCG